MQTPRLVGLGCAASRLLKFCAKKIFAHFVLYAASSHCFNIGPDLHLEPASSTTFWLRDEIVFNKPAELHNQIITILSLNTKNLDVFFKFIFLQHFYGLNLISNVNKNNLRSLKM